MVSIFRWCSKIGIDLKPGIAVSIGINGFKSHNFDLGSESERILVECKAHKWTESGNIPSAKLTVTNQKLQQSD